MARCSRSSSCRGSACRLPSDSLLLFNTTRTLSAGLHLRQTQSATARLRYCRARRGAKIVNFPVCAARGRDRRVMHPVPLTIRICYMYRYLGLL